MSGELQTIPARHGVATFVPRGRTIKVINTYGKQVVSMWAFSLGAPPEKDEDEEEIDAEKVKEQAEGLKKAVEEGAGKETAPPTKGDEKEPAKEENPVKEEEKDEKKVETTVEEKDGAKKDAEDLPNQALDGEKSTESADASAKQASKRTWASYLPSIPYRNKGAASKPDDVPKPNAEEEKAQNEANTKKWSSYIPTGKSFSSYVPNVQLPDSKEAVSSFKSSHYRDPNKSYAEQLYDFSKTPVGAGTIAGECSMIYQATKCREFVHDVSTLTAHSCNRFRLRLLSLRSLFCIHLYKPLGLLSATYGVSFPPTHASLVAQACPRSRR